ncbi:hypothetical protein [Granulicella sp. S190]|uniref:hypothetical protein n=1 Tax=Granulicella sp. S190 TaxID=1747226 RepID=UPI00131C9FAE|nr:hypothetical protein [Granulicella sp. S190]
MALLLRRLKRTHIWKRLLVERFSEPLHLNLLSLVVAVFGSLRTKILFDLCIRQQHAFGLLTAADDALAGGYKSVTVIEFGVANGVGLLNICALAQKISKLTGISFNIVGFDNVNGMPPLRDYRDHPELYQPGWFPMEEPAQLRAKLPANARLILGDITDTIPDYLSTLSGDSPIGFVSVDVDYYWSTVNALKSLVAVPELYLPRVTMYFDDIARAEHNPWCGELAAIGDFNAANGSRKIAPYNFLRVNRLFKNAMWIDQMYTLHVLDHPARFRALRDHGRVIIDNPYMGLKGREG